MARRPVILAMVLAGGEGRRLLPLTADRAKPAVPFGGHYRLVDFVLSNLANAGYFRIAVLTQYKSHSLDLHVSTAWRLSSPLGNFVTPVPAQQRLGPRWFLGSADAILQNLNLVNDERPDHLIVFGADHIYRMDPRQMVDQHIEAGAGCTVAGIRVPREQSSQVGVIETAPGRRTIARFLEKPSEASGLPDSPDQILASMGNYVFSTEALVEALHADAADEGSVHDMGGSIVPLFVDRGQAEVYDFAGNEVPGATDRDWGYWRDVGTIDAYYEASMDLCAVHPIFNLYNREWPILTQMPQRPAAKFVFEQGERTGMAVDSIVSPGCIISGGTVRHSVLSPDVRVEAGAVVEGSVVMHGADIGRGAVVRNAILDKNVVVPPGGMVGVDRERDLAQWRVSEAGITVVGKNEVVPA